MIQAGCGVRLDQFTVGVTANDHAVHGTRERIRGDPALGKFLGGFLPMPEFVLSAIAPAEGLSRLVGFNS